MPLRAVGAGGRAGRGRFTRLATPARHTPAENAQRQNAPSRQNVARTCCRPRQRGACGWVVGCWLSRDASGAPRAARPWRMPEERGVPPWTEVAARTSPRVAGRQSPRTNGLSKRRSTTVNGRRSTGRIRSGARSAAKVHAGRYLSAPKMQNTTYKRQAECVNRLRAKNEMLGSRKRVRVVLQFRTNPFRRVGKRLVAAPPASNSEGPLKAPLAVRGYVKQRRHDSAGVGAFRADVFQ